MLKLLQRKICLLYLLAAFAGFAQPPSVPDATTKLPSDHAERMARGLKLFYQSVRAVLNENCLKCHGGEKTKGEFDLTTREGLLNGGAEGAAIVLWDAKASKLVKLISHTDDPHMPSKQEKLSDDAIRQIAAWIDNGAPYDKPLLEKLPTAKPRSTVTDVDRDYWAFRPLKQVEISALADPKSKTWPRTLIDNFVLEKLAAKNLKPNPVAAKRKLIRRAYFDLIGLPPKPEEVEVFLNDKSPDAYAKLIDRLLASPHYGERWGRHWLDVARFAESHGFEHDYDRPFAYHFRDFVIKALNQDMPYDQFVRWQLAGDEFEPDNPLALMATGFLGAGVFPTQITANEVERTRYDALDDMAAMTGTAMLGLTIGCARCHDHKFDPIPTSDYYRLLSTFTTTVRSDIELDLNPEIYREDKAKFDVEHAPLVAALEKYERDQLPARFEQWLASGAKMPTRTGWSLLELASSKSSGGATFTKLDDGSVLASGTNADFDTYTFVVNTQTKGITAIRLEALAHESFAKGGPGRAANGNFGLGRIKLTAAPLAEPTKTIEVKLVNPKASFEQNDKNLSIAAALDGDKKTGWAIDPQFGKDHAAVFEVESEIGFDSGTVLTFTLEFTVNNQHNIGRPRLSITTASKPVGLDGTVIPANVMESLSALHVSKSTETISSEDRVALLAWWKTSEPGWQQWNEPIQTHLKQAPKPKLTKVMVCAEGYPPMRWHTQGADFFKETHFLNRGSTDQKRDVASQSFLQVLMRAPEKETRWQSPPPKGARFSNRRRALANWITDTDQGAGNLLARVIVNRLWQHHLGEGIVATPNDFGVQGQRPTHPELLDWLAGELIRGGWRLKPLHKLIMTSAVYLQDTQSDPQKEKIDPNNQLLARRVPRRLEAEVIRDSVLAVSDTLDETMFGPGTLDSKQNRRSIYFMIKRSQLVPMMQLFDAPEPLVSLGNRPSTTIAPQALLFMNNTNVRTASLEFAKRLEPAAAKSLPQAIKFGYAIALGRPPTNAELADAVAFVQQQTKAYASDKKPDAHKLALADLCQVVMSLNEFVYVE
ncbi:MAG: DUF1549 domain-containing protein [Verrucomicrobia bacterium]|nr:DUF1549 domain-containing protein [Verrucomicrobiota bacterium]